MTRALGIEGDVNADSWVLPMVVGDRYVLCSDGLVDEVDDEEIAAILRPVARPLDITAFPRPQVILVIGVNGSGKTTTIAKLAHWLQEDDYSVMLAAGDTFRAAAVEQLQVWGERNNVPVIAQHTGADSASVIFDALQAAKARGIDDIIADTAGRLHNKNHLMDELSKVKRVMAKVDGSAQTKRPTRTSAR